MANRFWVGGTGTWNSTNTTNWSTTTGPTGTPGASVPGPADIAIFDNNSGGGVVTIDSPNGANTVNIQGLTFGTFTGTLDNSVNNNNVTIGASTFAGTGTGARTLNMGSGTWTMTAPQGSPWNITDGTNLVLNAGTSHIVYSGTPNQNRGFTGAGKTYHNLTINNPAGTHYGSSLIANNTFNNVTVNNIRVLALAGGSIQTINGSLIYDGSASAPSILNTTTGATAQLIVANDNTLNNLCVGGIVKGGAGSITANNSYNWGGNTNVTINPPPAVSGTGRRRHGFAGMGVS